VSAPTFYVFAYGSNLSTARLAERVGRIEVVGAGSLHEHELRFHKQSKDGSTKADAFFTGSPAHRVLGAVYSLHLESKRKLDEFEGLNTQYFEAELSIEVAAGGSVAATVYRARPDRIDTAGRPYDWYREHVLVGAREHGLPAQYVETIESVPVVRDPDEARRDREFAVSRTPSRRS
jgi:gamma-glutamylcyclotransferase (GGCT)/AIG2-like uncharacterized protein YtfP